MEKVIKDGNVAVLISRGYGAGWYTWNQEHQELLFHPKLIEMVENNKTKEITEEWIFENLDIPDIYCGGTDGLTIIWLPIGTAFKINEYDGNESLETFEDLFLIA